MTRIQIFRGSLKGKRFYRTMGTAQKAAKRVSSRIKSGLVFIVSSKKGFSVHRVKK